MPPSLLVVGDLEAPEIAYALERLARHAALTCVASVEDALAWCERHQGAGPDVLMLAASRPGQWPASALERLHQAAPLARLVALLGTWCEGEVRTGTPWPGVPRVYWHEAELAFCHEVLGTSGRAGWDLPRTASDADRLLFVTEMLRSPAQRGLVAVRATQCDTYEAIADALQAAGYTAHWWRDPQPLAAAAVHAIVWDLDHFRDSERTRLSQQVGQHQDVPWTVLLGFPRLTDLEQLAALGITRCLPKPWRITELWEALARPSPVTPGPEAP